MKFFTEFDVLCIKNNVGSSGLEIEGIYRVSGMKSKVDTLKELYDQGMYPFLQRLWHMAIDPLNPKIASYFSLQCHPK